MADLNLITILPPPQVAGIQNLPLSPGVTSHAATLLAALPPGTVLKGFIVNRDAAGNPVLRTDRGDIVFSTQFYLKIGSEVVIRIGNTAGNAQAHIVTVDGQPPEIAQNISAFAQDEDVVVNSQLAKPQSGAQLNAAKPVNVLPQAQPSTVTATLVTPPKDLPAASHPVPAGAQLALKLITITAPSTPAPPATHASIIPPPDSTSPAQAVSYATYARAAGTTLPAAAPPGTGTDAAHTQVLAASTPPNAQNANTIAVSTSPAHVHPALPQATSIPTVTAGGYPAESTISSATLQYVSFTNAVAASSSGILAARELPLGLPASIPASHGIPSALQSLLPEAGAAPLPGTVTLSPASAPAPAARTAFQPGNIITAQVIGHEPTGEVLAQTQAGVVRVQAGGFIPLGSSITFEIARITPPSASPVPAGQQAAPAPLAELAQQWTSLQQVFSLLKGRTTPSGLESLLVTAAANPAQPAAAAMPAITGMELSNGLLLFMAALRGGSFRDWVGADNARWLEEHGNAALIKKAEAEFAGMARQFSEAAPHQWQALFIPVAVEGALHQLRLFIKRDRKQDSPARNQKGDEDTRFVIEVDLTQLGELQMDGFVRKHGRAVEFDMVIRSLTPLAQEIQEDILAIYTSTGALTGYTGSLSFQPVKAFPINPMQEIVAAAGTVVA